MAKNPRIPLKPNLIKPDCSHFEMICEWKYADDFVVRMLRADIRRYASNNYGRLWVYQNPEDEYVGFGSLALCDEYIALTDGLIYPYIPLLAVHPDLQGRGYGSSIVQHLISEAVLLGSSPGYSQALLLDVYEFSKGAIGLYEKNGFVRLTDEPSIDPDENDAPYWIMGFGLSFEP